MDSKGRGKSGSPLLNDLDKKLKENTEEHTCTICGHRGVDVHEYPTRVFCKDTTDCFCDNFADCHARKVTRGG